MGPDDPEGRSPDPGDPTGSLPDDQEAMRPILEPAETLTITQSEREVAIDETFGRSRTLHPDGKKRKADNGTSEVKARWKNGSLVVETRRDRGRKIVETWQRSVDGTRLTATYKIEGPSGPALTLKRVYTLSPALRTSGYTLPGRPPLDHHRGRQVLSTRAMSISVSAAIPAPTASYVYFVTQDVNDAVRAAVATL